VDRRFQARLADYILKVESQSSNRLLSVTEIDALRFSHEQNANANRSSVPSLASVKWDALKWLQFSPSVEQPSAIVSDVHVQNALKLGG
jgi:hypothetical protein